MDRQITSSDLRKNIKSEFNKVCDDHEIVLATRPNGKNVILMSEEDYRSLNETAYLLSSENNKKRLLDAMNSQGTSFDSLDEMEKSLGI
jgi:antitoxin YefM